MLVVLASLSLLQGRQKSGISSLSLSLSSLLRATVSSGHVLRACAWYMLQLGRQQSHCRFVLTCGAISTVWFLSRHSFRSRCEFRMNLCQSSSEPFQPAVPQNFCDRYRAGKRTSNAFRRSLDFVGNIRIAGRLTSCQRSAVHLKPFGSSCMDCM